MSRAGKTAVLGRGRFPRVSGDEPGISRALGIEDAFSPRERG